MANNIEDNQMTEEKPRHSRFVFSGSAVAFGGRIRRPEDVFLKAAAVSHLPVTGGLSEAHVTGADTAQHHYKDYLTFSEAHSHAHGDFNDPVKAAEFTHGNHGHNDLPADTVVEAKLHDLRIDAPAQPDKKTPRLIFEVKKLHVRMQTTTSFTAQHIRTLSGVFEEIKISSVSESGAADVVVGLKVSTATNVFSENETKAKLMDRYAKDADFRKKYEVCFHPLGDGKKGFIGNLVAKHEIPYADRGPIVATFVNGLELTGPAPQGVEVLNNRLTIPGLGKIYFGEIIINDHYQRSSLLRFELGSVVGGEVTCCESSSNGNRIPPTS